MPGAPAAAPRSKSSDEAPPAGCVAELEGLGREELNGLRGVCLVQTEEFLGKGRCGVRLDDGRELSIGVRNLAPILTLENVPGKGIGAFARTPIKAGDLLVREAPALVGRLGQEPDRRQFRALPESRKRAVMELCDAYVGGGTGR